MGKRRFARIVSVCLALILLLGLTACGFNARSLLDRMIPGREKTEETASPTPAEPSATVAPTPTMPAPTAPPETAGAKEDAPPEDDPDVLPDGGFVFDLAGLLTDAECSQLNAAAKDASLRYGCGIYVAVFDDMTDYGFHDIEAFSESVFTQWELGIGPQRDCILLVLSMSGRDYDLCAHGNTANYAFTDYGKELLADEFLDDFRVNDWAGGFRDYISQCALMLRRASQGDPIGILS